MAQNETGNAIRLRRAYQRRRAGRSVFQIEADAVSLVEALIAARLLDPTQVDDKQAVAAALSRFIKVALLDHYGRGK